MSDDIEPAPTLGKGELAALGVVEINVYVQPKYQMPGSVKIMAYITPRNFRIIFRSA